MKQDLNATYTTMTVCKCELKCTYYKHSLLVVPKVFSYIYGESWNGISGG